MRKSSPGQDCENPAEKQGNRKEATAKVTPDRVRKAEYPRVPRKGDLTTWYPGTLLTKGRSRGQYLSEGESAPRGRRTPKRIHGSRSGEKRRAAYGNIHETLRHRGNSAKEQGAGNEREGSGRARCEKASRNEEGSGEKPVRRELLAAEYRKGKEVKDRHQSACRPLNAWRWMRPADEKRNADGTTKVLEGEGESRALISTA